MKKNKAAKMKAVRAWALVDSAGETYKADNGCPWLFKVRPEGTGWLPVRIEIREVPK